MPWKIGDVHSQVLFRKSARKVRHDSFVGANPVKQDNRALRHRFAFLDRSRFQLARARVHQIRFLAIGRRKRKPRA